MRSFVIFLALLLVCACGGGGGGGSGNPGDNNSDNNSDNNTDNSIITNFAEFKAMGDNCSRDYILEANITVNEPWVAICSAGGGYTGTFDGGGKTVTFTNDISGGLFAKLGTNGKVKDIKIDIAAQANITGIDIATNENPTDFFNAFGGVAALAEESSLGIENCFVNIEGNISTMNYFGGVAGYTGSKISACSVVIEGNITASKYGGGIAAYGKPYNSSIDNCTAYINGNVSAYSAGGIGGHIGEYSHISDSFAVITGSILAKEHAGGIAGRSGDITNSFAVVKGDIKAISTGSGEYNSAGGVAGYTGDTLKKTFAVVLGNIEVSAGGIGSHSFIGGVAGYGAYQFDSNVAVVAPSHIGNADYKGNVLGGDGTSGENYAYRSTGTANDKNGEGVILKQLMSAEWWRSVGFDDSAWHLEAGKLPMQKNFYDNDAELIDLWPFIESAAVKDPSNLKSANFNCSGDITLDTEVIITTEWTGLCSSTSYYGTFDGDNYTIIFKENVTGGFFAMLGNGINGTVKNLNIMAMKNISGIDVASVNYAGGVAAYTQNNSLIDNCTVTAIGNITANGNYSYVGGIAGYASNNSAINNCSAHIGGNITVNSEGNYNHAGGVVGVTYGSINNSTAIVGGNITVNGDSYNYAGGVTGTAKYNIDNSSANIGGDITVSGSNSSAGGVAGMALYNIDNSFANIGGGIEINGSNSSAGGVAGQAQGNIDNSFANISGDITINGDYSSAGGMAGNSQGNIDNSSANIGGDITVSGTTGTVAGGMAGRNASGKSFNNNITFVAGNITALGYAGGVAGDLHGISDKNYIIVAGSISAFYAGGVAGYVDAGGIVSNSVAVIDPTKITGANKGNIWGYSGGTGTNNHIFTKGGTGFNTPDGQDGKSVSAVALKSRDWWRNVVGFGTNNWHIEDGYMPLPKALYDSGISPSPFPDWVKDN